MTKLTEAIIANLSNVLVLFLETKICIIEIYASKSPLVEALPHRKETHMTLSDISHSLILFAISRASFSSPSMAP